MNKEDEDMKIKDYTNAQLLERYTRLCFLITNYPTNNGYNREHHKVFNELCKRLKLNEEEINNITERW